MQPAALQHLLQLFDSQFPVGAFAHSGGLETYGQAGASVPELRELLRAQVALGWGRGELGAACLAWHAATVHDLSALARRVDAFKVIPATRDTSVRLGRRTLLLLQRLHPRAFADFTIDPPHHAVVIGAAGRRLGLELEPMLTAFAQSLASGMLAAATRSMPVGPQQAQELLLELHPFLREAVARAGRDPESCLFTSTPGLDIRAYQQKHLTTRLFQS